MKFPLESLSGEAGLAVAVLIGFWFGFVLERAGFGRATKLAAQFYLHDMTVFKVMFTAIVTAMLGVVVLQGLGWVDLRSLAQTAISDTYWWPMLFGGALLGVGFILSGYCPGTSLVSAASGHVDGLLTFLGVVVGSVLFGEAYPLVEKFYLSGHAGQVFLFDLLGVPASVLAAGVAAGAVACFLGAEWVERRAASWFGLTVPEDAPSANEPSGRRLTFAWFGLGALVALLVLAVPFGRPTARAARAHSVQLLDVETFARRLVEQPWKLWIVDVRPEAEFQAKRIPGSERADLEELTELGLQYSPGVKDLVLVGDASLSERDLPDVVHQYRGRVFLLKGGFPAWRRFALETPKPPAPDASPEQLEAYRFRAGLHAAVTGVKAPPPPKTNRKFVPPPRRKSGGCS